MGEHIDGWGEKLFKKLGLQRVEWQLKSFDEDARYNRSSKYFLFLAHLLYNDESELSSSDTYIAAIVSMPQKMSLGRYFMLLKEISLKMINFELIKPNFQGLCQMRGAKNFSLEIFRQILTIFKLTVTITL